MAFFGLDGIERQLKQAQRELMQKDGQIATLHHATREKEGTIQKLQLELERLKEEREDLVLAQSSTGASSSSAGPAVEDGSKALIQRQLMDAREKIAKLEEQVRVAALRPDSSQSRMTPLSSSSSSSSSTTSSPTSRTKPNRRRASSVTTHNRITELESELEAMRLASGPSSNEIDNLKNQLANVRRDLNKAINEKIALEGKTKKEVEAVRTQLDDANFELDALRMDMQGGGGVSKSGVEKMKKAWDGERAELSQKVKEVQLVVEEQKREIEVLVKKAQRVDDLQNQLEVAASASSGGTDSDSDQAAALKKRITILEEEIAQARSTTATSAPAGPSDFAMRRLQRQLDQATREKKELEEAYEKSEEENYALKSRLPLPSSPVLKAVTIQPVDEARIDELEMAVQNMTAEKVDMGSTLQAVRAELVQKVEELSAAHAQLEDVQAVLQEVREKAENSATAHAASQADVERLKNDVTAKEQEVAQITQRLASLEQEVDAEKQKRTAVDSEILDLRQRLQSIDGELVKRQEDLGLAQRAVQQQQQTLDGRSHDDDEFDRIEQQLEELRSNAASIAQAAVDAEEKQRAAEEAEALAKRDCLKARQEQDRLMHELADIQQREADYMALSAEKETSLRTLKQELEEEKATSSAFKTQLEDLEANLAVTQAEHDKAREDFEVILKEKLDIESRLTALQDNAADRSTDSEAQQRNEELFQVKEDLELARQTLNAKIESLREELELTSFAKGKDLEESQTKLTEANRRISELEAQLHSARSPTSGAEHVGLLHATIQRIRSERDELRQSLSFSQNESRFAVKAAQADRESALDELQKAKLEVKQNVAIRDTLQAEIESIRQRVQQKESDLERVTSSFADAAQEKGDYADKVTQLDRQMEALRTELSDKVQQLEENGRMFAELNHQLVLARSNNDAEKRHRRISDTVRQERLAELGTITESASAPPGPAAFPTLSRRSSGHVRTRSEVMPLLLGGEAPLNAKIAELEGEVSALKRKLDRRNETITGLQRENEKLKMDVELNKDSANEFDELVAERDELAASIEEKSVMINSLQATVDDKVAEHVARNALMEQQLASSASAHDSAMSSMIISILVQRQRVSRATQAWRQASRIGGAQQRRIAAGLNKAEQLASQVDTLEAELVSLDSQLQAGLVREDGLAVQLQKLQAIETDAIAAKGQVVELEGQLIAANARTAELQSEISDLLDKLNAGERIKTQATAELDVLLSEKTAEADTVKAELRDLEVQLEERTREASESNSKLEEQKAVLETVQQELEEEKRSVQRVMAEKDSVLPELKISQDKIVSLEADLAAETARGQSAVAESESLRADIAVLQTQLDEANKASAGSVTSLEKTISELEESLSAARASEAALQDDVAKHVATTDELKERAETLQAELDAAKSSTTDHALGLQRQLAEMEVKLRNTEETEASLQSEVATATKIIDGLRGEIDSMRTQLDEAREGTTDRTLHLQSEIAQLQEKLQKTSISGGRLQEDWRSLTAKHDEVVQNLDRLTSEVEVAKHDLMKRDEQVESLTAEVARLEKEGRRTAGMLKFKEAEVENRANAIVPLQEKLQLRQQDLNSAAETLRSQQIELARLAALNTKLKEALEAAEQSPSPAGQDIDGLKERIEELEAALSLKAQELDEADDRTREKYKANVKLEKKVAKLQRQLMAYETASNTAANVERSKPAALTPSPALTLVVPPTSSIGMPPPASTVPLNSHRSAVPATAAAPTPTGRAPLRPVNPFEPTSQLQNTPTSLKRLREKDAGDEKPLPAEAIMLPPSSNPVFAAAISAIKRTPKSFTPKRNLVFGGENGMGLGESQRPVVRNIFARTNSSEMTPGGNGGRNVNAPLFQQ